MLSGNIMLKQLRNSTKNKLKRSQTINTFFFLTQINPFLATKSTCKLVFFLLLTSRPSTTSRWASLRRHSVILYNRILNS